MNNIPNIAIAIRSFNFHSDTYTKLSKSTNIIFVNHSGQRLTEQDLCKSITNANGIIAGTESYNENVLNAAPHLKVISRVGVGLDNIDLDYAKKRGICILNTPLAPVDAVAEHTIALIFSIFKKIPQYYDNVHREDYSIQQGSLLSGKTIGIIGLGRIGQKVATLLDALGTKIMYYDPFLKKDMPEKWVRIDHLDNLFRTADVISLHTSPQYGNIPFLDKNAFAQCKAGVVIINTARGSLIDEIALIHAIDSGIVSSAGLDVVSVEPYKGPLLDYPQVVITPHVASNTVESRQQMEIEAVENMLHTFGI
jgi:D-3-phosphoglycerate dehydrogenase